MHYLYISNQGNKWNQSSECNATTKQNFHQITSGDYEGNYDGKHFSFFLGDGGCMGEKRGFFEKILTNKREIEKNFDVI